MEGTISFSGSTLGPSDPLCTELTAYIKVSSGVVILGQSRNICDLLYVAV